MHSASERRAALPFAHLSFAPIVVALFLAATAALRAAAWPIETPDLHPDPAWRWGTLANGLRYVVRQNAVPAGRVSYRLIVEVGAMHERPDERGFSHFVEHMAFNGTRHFPGESIRAEMERRGIGFGPESSAFTFVTHTIYQFDAPGNGPAEIDWVLGVLRDFADGVQFESREVKRERGVIASESRDRRSVAQRFELRRRRELYPLSPLSNNVEGDPEKATPEKLRAFYRKWYRPERMILAVVGDAAPETLAAAVERQFSSLAAPADPAPVVDVGFLENPAEATASIVHDAEAGGLYLEVASVTLRREDGLAERRRAMAAGIASQVLTERLQKITRETGGVFSSAGARFLAATPHATEASVYIQSTSDAWNTSATTLARELRRTLEMTVYQAEADAAKSRVLRSNELALASASTADSSELAAWVAQEALWRVVSTSPVENLRIARELLPAITVFEVAEAWRSLWQQRRARLFGYGYFPVRDSAAMVDAAFTAENRRPLEAPARPNVVEFPYREFGPAGEIRSRRHDEATDIHLIEFANGVRVALKRTAFEANQVQFALTLGHGLLTAPPYKAALAPLASASLLDGGLNRIPVAELHHLLSVEPITMQFSVNEGSFNFSGTMPPEKADLTLRLLCAYLTDARWDEKAIAAAKTNLISRHAESLRTTEGVLGLHSFHEATHHDARYRAPAPEDIAKIERADLRTWLEVPLREAPLDFALVGDFDPETVVPILARTLGALPERAEPRAEEFPVHFVKKGGEFPVSGPVTSERAAIQFLWPADQGRDFHASRRLEVLSAVLGERILQRVREDLGAAYSPSADYWRSDIGTEEGYLLAFVTTAPKMAAKVRKLILQEADDLARHGATAAELATAVTPIIARTRVQLKGNAYWLWHIALKAHRKPEALTWPATRTTDFERITLADINHLAREILPRDRALQFTVLPAKR
ncbi:MAG: insulinase family protein [Opitutae bacterium]|nr:insulinase family protein [Opitutae bacterium]